MTRDLIPLFLAALVGACTPGSTSGTATTGSTVIPTGLAKVQATLQKFTVADLQAADADAKVHNDTLAATCYEALIPAVQAQPELIPNAPKGLFTAFQEGRDGVNAIQAAPAALKGLNVACGPLVLDAEQTVIALGVKIAPAALPALPMLPPLP